MFMDADGLLEELFPPDWCDSHLLHSAYVAQFVSCSPQEWTSWVASGRSGITGFPSLVNCRSGVLGRAKVRREIERRGFSGEPNFKYQTENFSIDDLDFDPLYWRRWSQLAESMPNIWERIMRRILDQPRSFSGTIPYSKSITCCDNRKYKSLTQADLVPSWILRFRALPCLPDTHGINYRPEELLRRTPETKPLLDTEPFISLHLDNEFTRPLSPVGCS